MGVAGAICLEPFLCPGPRVPTAICKCREKAAELLASIPCSSQRQELDAVYKSELLVVVMLLLSWGCWLWSVLPSSRLLPQPASAKLAGSGVAGPLLLKQRAEFLPISMEEPFISGSSTCCFSPLPASLPGGVRARVVASPALPWGQTETSPAWAGAAGTVISLCLCRAGRAPQSPRPGS